MHERQEPAFTGNLWTSHRACGRCGLCVEVVDLGEQATFRYDFTDWERVCRCPALGGPSACFLTASREAECADRGKRR
jgi:hypothetical protein